MSDVPPQDGRLGGLVPLQRLDEINPTINTIEPGQLPTEPLLFEPTFGNTVTTDTGQQFDLDNLRVDGDDGAIRLPNADGSGERVVQIDQLNSQQLQQLLAVVQGQDPGVRLPFTVEGSGGVGAPSGLLRLGLQNPFPTNEFAPLERNLRSQLGVTQEQEQQANLDLQRNYARFGLSHTENGGASLYDQQFAPDSTSRSTLYNAVTAQSDDWFQEELGQLNTIGRQTEQRLRTALLDIEAFLETETGEDLDLSASELIALRQAYRDRLDQVREVRAAYADDLRNRQFLVQNGDFGALPDALALSEQQASLIEFELDERQHTLEAYGEWRRIASDTSLTSRMTSELVRGYLNGTYSAVDLEAQLNIPDSRAEVGPDGIRPRLFSEEAKTLMREQLQTILGLDDVFQPVEGGVGFNPAYLGERELRAMDALTIGFDEDFSEILGVEQGERRIIDNEITINQLRDGRGVEFAEPGAETDVNIFDPFESNE